MFESVSKFFSLEDEEPQQAIKIEGKANYLLQPQVQGVVLTNASSLKLSAFGDKRMTKPIDMKIRWYRVVEGRNYELGIADQQEY